MENTTTETPTTETPTTTQAPTEAQPIAVGIADIAFIVQIIDTVSRRGAFSGEELQTIGTYRNKIDSWIKQNSPKTPESQPAQSGNTEKSPE